MRRWILILGASSGMGEAAARAFAAEGYNILGVHLDRRASLGRVDAVVADLRVHGHEVHFFNENAADDAGRLSMIQRISAILDEHGGRIQVLLHSLAFGSLKAYVPEEGKGATRKQIEMTLDVMANSLVYWTQDLVEAGLFGENSRILALTSTGSQRAWRQYGPVSAAKAALETHVRQLCLELAPRGITVNAIMAGVTLTPALAKIPGSDRAVRASLLRNPHGRLTRPEDVAAALVALAHPGTYWITGNTIRVDGGEDFCA